MINAVKDGQIGSSFLFEAFDDLGNMAVSGNRIGDSRIRMATPKFPIPSGL